MKLSSGIDLARGYAWTACCGLLQPAVVARPDWLTWAIARRHDMHMVECSKARRARREARDPNADARGGEAA